MTYKVSSRLNHSSELVGADGTITVEVKRVEGFIGIETWSSSESLSQGFSCVFASDVSSPHALEFESGIWEENIISSDDSWDVVGSSSQDHGSIVAIVGEESLLEFRDTESSVTRFIVSLEEETAFIISWVNTNGVKTSLELMNIDLTISWLIEDTEGISDIEVRFMGKVDLGSFDLLFEVTEFFEGMDKLVFIVESESWLRGGSNWRSRSSWGRVGGSGSRHGSSWG